MAMDADIRRFESDNVSLAGQHVNRRDQMFYWLIQEFPTLDWPMPAGHSESSKMNLSRHRLAETLSFELITLASGRSRVRIAVLNARDIDAYEQLIQGSALRFDTLRDFVERHGHIPATAAS